MELARRQPLHRLDWGIRTIGKQPAEMRLNGVDKVASKERTEITIAFTRDRNKGKRLALIASGSHAFVAAAWISLRSYGIYDEFFQSSMDPHDPCRSLPLDH